MKLRRLRRRRQGSALIELAMSMLVLLPMLVGATSLGLNMIRVQQAQQLCRDAGSMYSRFVDFTMTANRTMLLEMGRGLGILDSSGNGVIILSKVTWVSDTDCTAAGYNTSTCTNRNQYVVVQRIYLGDKTLRSSSFGTPSEGGINQTTRNVNNVYTDTSCRATNFSTLITLNDDEFSYVAEVFVRGAAWPTTGLAGFAGNSVYTRVLF